VTDSTDTIVKLEKTFWQSMVDKDADKAMTMIADQCLITGPMGAMRSDPADYKRMTEQGDWELDAFEFSDVQVIFPVEDTAIIAYKVTRRHDEGPGDGPRMCRLDHLGARRRRVEMRAAHETIVGDMPLTN
jgi:hypothetical protein